MAFNLPNPQSFHTTNSSTNVGTLGTLDTLTTKVGGNLPLTQRGSQYQNKTSSSASGVPAGVFFGINGQNATSVIDATNGNFVFLWSVQYNAPNRIQNSNLANGGSRLRLSSGSNPTENYKDFFIGGNDTPFCSSQAGPVTICIDLASINNNLEVGTFDLSEVSAYSHATVRLNLQGGSTTLTFYQRSFLFSADKGSSNLPNFTGLSNFDDAILEVQGTDYTDKIGSWLTKSGSSFFIPCPFAFGNGSNGVNFNDAGVSVVSPSNNSPKQENFRLTDNSMQVSYNPSSNLTNNNVVLSGSYAWGVPSIWDFDTDAPFTMSGNFVGMGDVTVGSGGVVSGNFSLGATENFASLKGGKCSVLSRGANIDGISVDGDLKILGTDTTTFNNVTSEFVRFTQAGTYTLNGCNIGEVRTPVNIVGQVILNTSNCVIGSNATPPTLTIVAQTAFALTGLQPNSEVRIYEAGTTNEITGIENSTTTYITTLSSPLIDLVVLNLQYLSIKIKNIDTQSDVALPIQQVFDRQYENL